MQFSRKTLKILEMNLSKLENMNFEGEHLNNMECPRVFHLFRLTEFGFLWLSTFWLKNHYYKQEIDYDLKILSIQWQKDSHGLFDYDMKQIIKSDLSVSKSQVLIRNGSSIVLDALDTDIEGKYGQNHQELLKIYKIRN